MFRRITAFVKRNEHYLSTVVFIGGFGTDLASFTFLNITAVNYLFIGYLVSASIFTVIALRFPRDQEQTGWLRRTVSIVAPLIVNFATGGLLSGCVIFYTKSAVLLVSWPFLLLLAIIFLGNEFFRSYRSHLVFQTVLFFFALYAYLIFALPLYVNRLGPKVFVESTGLAVVVFAGFLFLLAITYKERIKSAFAYIATGAASVVAVVVLLYFTGLVPPIPLTLKESGIYQTIVHTDKGYEVTHEGSAGWSRFWKRTIHHVPGTPLYAYSAVFAPTAFSANVMHRWEHYDPVQKKWITRSLVAFSLSGGREGGYRGYSQKDDPEAGDWRVSIETTEGQVIGLLRFTVVNVDVPPNVSSETK